MADVEEFETDSTIDQQIDIAVGDEESDYDAEEIVGATDRNGLTGTPQVPVPPVQRPARMSQVKKLGVSVVACLRHPPGYTASSHRG